MDKKSKKKFIPGFSVEFINDKSGNPSSVLMQLQDYNQLIEDYQDLALMASRSDDEYVPLEDILEDLD